MGMDVFLLRIWFLPALNVSFLPLLFHSVTQSMSNYSLDPTTKLVRSLKHEQQQQQQHTKSIVAVVLYFLCTR